MLELYFSQNFPFWNKLSPKEKDLLINNSEILKYKKNEIIHDSTECTGVLLVIKGQLRVYILSEEGKEITLYRLSENEVCILSASCILKNITFSIYVDAITDVEIIKISASAFKETKNSNIAVEAFTTDIINKSFSETMWACSVPSTRWIRPESWRSPRSPCFRPSSASRSSRRRSWVA